MSEMYRQYTLVRETGNVKAWLVTWLPTKRGGVDIEVGTRLTLEDYPEKVWTVADHSVKQLSREEVSALRTSARNFGPSLDDDTRVA